MKYITFNSACSYAGVANMLARLGVETDDRTIALEMGLPFLFAREEGGYAAGPMLQSAQWFNLYLHPLGIRMEERLLPAENVPDYLRGEKTAMLGIRMGEAGKHALTYVGSCEKGLRFINNKWQQEDAPEEMVFSDRELLERMDESCMVATLQIIEPTSVDIRELMAWSISVLEENLREIEAIASKLQPMVSLRGRLNTLFRPLLLDGITMLDLLGEEKLKEKFSAIQHAFLTALRSSEPQLRLGDHIYLEALREAVTEYQNLIRRELDERKDETHAF